MVGIAVCRDILWYSADEYSSRWPCAAACGCGSRLSAWDGARHSDIRRWDFVSSAWASLRGCRNHADLRWSCVDAPMTPDLHRPLSEVGRLVVSEVFVRSARRLVACVRLQGCRLERSAMEMPSPRLIAASIDFFWLLWRVLHRTTSRRTTSSTPASPGDLGGVVRKGYAICQANPYGFSLLPYVATTGPRRVRSWRSFRRGTARRVVLNPSVAMLVGRHQNSVSMSDSQMLTGELGSAGDCTISCSSFTRTRSTHSCSDTRSGRPNRKVH